MTDNQILEQQRAAEKAKLLQWMKEPQQEKAGDKYSKLAADIEQDKEEGITFLQAFSMTKREMMDAPSAPNGNFKMSTGTEQSGISDLKQSIEEMNGVGISLVVNYMAAKETIKMNR